MSRELMKLALEELQNARDHIYLLPENEQPLTEEQILNRINAAITVLHQEVYRDVIRARGAEMTTMDDAIAAGDGVLMNEQAALLRECRMALDHLLRDKPMLAAKVCGTTTLGNLRAMLHEYRPQGVFGGMK